MAVNEVAISVINRAQALVYDVLAASMIRSLVCLSRYQTYLMVSSYTLHMRATAFSSKFYIHYDIVF